MLGAGATRTFPLLSNLIESLARGERSEKIPLGEPVMRHPNPTANADQELRGRIHEGNFPS